MFSRGFFLRVVKSGDCVVKSEPPLIIHLLTGTETDLVPFLIEHGQRVYPHTNVIDDLEKLCIANMTDPFNW